MSAEDSSSAQTVQRQVRLLLTTRDGELALPENTGPILVPTGWFFVHLPELQYMIFVF